MESLVLSLMSKQNSRNKNCGCLVFSLACRLKLLAALLFCSLSLSHRATQVYNPGSFALGERENDGAKRRLVWESERLEDLFAS